MSNVQTKRTSSNRRNTTTRPRVTAVVTAIAGESEASDDVIDVVATELPTSNPQDIEDNKETTMSNKKPAVVTEAEVVDTPVETAAPFFSKAMEFVTDGVKNPVVQKVLFGALLVGYGIYKYRKRVTPSK